MEYADKTSTPSGRDLFIVALRQWEASDDFYNGKYKAIKLIVASWDKFYSPHLSARVSISRRHVSFSAQKVFHIFD